MAGSPMDLHFDCVFYYVRDLQAAIRFYSDVLELSLSSHDAVARYDVDGVQFELVPASEERQMTGQGNARLCLRVTSIEITAEQLRERGVSVGPVQVVPGGKLATFEDPDKNELVIWQYTS